MCTWIFLIVTWQPWSGCAAHKYFCSLCVKSFALSALVRLGNRVSLASFVLEGPGIRQKDGPWWHYYYYYYARPFSDRLISFFKGFFFLQLNIYYTYRFYLNDEYHLHYMPATALIADLLVSTKGSLFEFTRGFWYIIVLDHWINLAIINCCGKKLYLRIN